MVKYIDLSLDPVVAAKYGQQTNKRLDALEKGRGIDQSQVRATRSGGGTVTPITSPRQPGQPTGLTLDNVFGSWNVDGHPRGVADISWTAPATDPTFAEVDHYEVRGFQDGDSIPDRLFATVKGGTNVRIQGLNAYDATFFVRAISPAGVAGQDSDSIRFSIPASTPVQAGKPTGLTFLGGDLSGALLGWTPPANQPFPITEYEIQTPTSVYVPGNVTQVWVDNTLAFTKTLMVRANNATGGWSDWSDPLDLSYSLPNPNPDAPTLTARIGGFDVASPAFAGAHPDIAHLVVQISSASSGPWTDSGATFDYTAGGVAYLSAAAGTAVWVRIALLSNRGAVLGTSTAVSVTPLAPAAIPSASTTVQGIVELATNAETTTGTDTTRAVTPAGVKAAIDAAPGQTHAGTGLNSVQLGPGANASGTDAVAIGDIATAGEAGLALGTSTVAGSSGVAVGPAATASGNSSAAFGAVAQATHANSTAVGNNAHTTKDHQVVLGTAADEVFIPGTLVGGTPVGTVTMYAGSSAPTGWLLCDGSEVSRTVYSALFAVVGTAYGAGNGSSTFNLPNPTGRTPVGRDAAQTEFNTLGKTGGAKTHTLTTAEMPNHSHEISVSGVDLGYGNSNASAGSGYGGFVNPGSDIKATATGGGGAHNNLQPYLVFNFIIKS